MFVVFADAPLFAAGGVGLGLGFGVAGVVSNFADTLRPIVTGRKRESARPIAEPIASRIAACTKIPMDLHEQPGLTEHLAGVGGEVRGIGERIECTRLKNHPRDPGMLMCWHERGSPGVKQRSQRKTAGSMAVQLLTSSGPTG